MFVVQGHLAGGKPQQIATMVQQVEPAVLPSMVSSRSALSELTVRQLRSECSARGVDLTGCIAKADIVDRLLATALPSQSPRDAPAPSALSPEHDRGSQDGVEPFSTGLANEATGWCQRWTPTSFCAKHTSLFGPRGRPAPHHFKWKLEKLAGFAAEEAAVEGDGRDLRTGPGAAVAPQGGEEGGPATWLVSPPEPSQAAAELTAPTTWAMPPPPPPELSKAGATKEGCLDESNRSTTVSPASSIEDGQPCRRLEDLCEEDEDFAEDEGAAEEALLAMPMKQLRSLCALRGVDNKDCFQKGEVVRRLLAFDSAAQQATSTPSFEAVCQEHAIFDAFPSFKVAPMTELRRECQARGFETAGLVSRCDLLRLIAHSGVQEPAVQAAPQPVEETRPIAALAPEAVPQPVEGTRPRLIPEEPTAQATRQPSEDERPRTAMAPEEPTAQAVPQPLDDERPCAVLAPEVLLATLDAAAGPSGSVEEEHREGSQPDTVAEGVPRSPPDDAAAVVDRTQRRARQARWFARMQSMSSAPPQSTVFSCTDGAEGKEVSSTSAEMSSASVAEPLASPPAMADAACCAAASAAGSRPADQDAKLDIDSLTAKEVVSLCLAWSIDLDGCLDRKDVIERLREHALHSGRTVLSETAGELNAKASTTGPGGKTEHKEGITSGLDYQSSLHWADVNVDDCETAAPQHRIVDGSAQDATEQPEVYQVESADGRESPDAAGLRRYISGGIIDFDELDELEHLTSKDGGLAFSAPPPSSSSMAAPRPALAGPGELSEVGGCAFSAPSPSSSSTAAPRPASAVAAREQPSQDPTWAELAEMPTRELKKFCRDEGVDVNGLFRKGEILDRLRNVRTGAEVSGRPRSPRDAGAGSSAEQGGGDLAALSVKQLLAIARQRGVDVAGCVEKAEIVACIQNGIKGLTSSSMPGTRAAAPPGPLPGAAASGPARAFSGGWIPASMASSLGEARGAAAAQPRVRAGSEAADGQPQPSASAHHAWRMPSSPSSNMTWSSRIRTYFDRYPGFTATLPPEAEVWTDNELDIYFGSNGEIWPRGKRPAWASKPQPFGCSSGDAGQARGPEARQSTRERATPPEVKAHFAALGLATTTPPDAVRRQYHRLARECHPDKNVDDLERATERFQAVNAAYEAIKQHLRF